MPSCHRGSVLTSSCVLMLQGPTCTRNGGGKKLKEIVDEMAAPFGVCFYLAYSTFCNAYNNKRLHTHTHTQTHNCQCVDVCGFSYADMINVAYVVKSCYNYAQIEVDAINCVSECAECGLGPNLETTAKGAEGPFAGRSLFRSLVLQKIVIGKENMDVRLRVF